MTKKCELTGKRPLKGHKVSHANNKTKRVIFPLLPQKKPRKIIKATPIAVKKSLLVIIGMTKSKKEFEILLFKNTINDLSISRILSSIKIDCNYSK